MGPGLWSVQVQSNALAALQALDEEVAEQVLAEGCITGDRVNGLCDGLTGEW
jgi:zeaxanthin epoxidase